MFIELTKYEGGKKYYNTEFIRSFVREPKYTVLELLYGTDLIKERPEEIMEMLKGSD